MRAAAQGSTRIAGGILLALGSVAGAGLLCEAFLRLALFGDVLPAFVARPLRQPDLYSHPSSDDFWKLRSRWQKPQLLRRLHHPRLGATIPRTATNPLGVAGAARARPAPGTEAAILFYGDSYLTTPLFPVSARIPQLLEARLPGATVWNFGMWSYGLDQMILRFEETYGHFRHPVVLIGVLTDDVDRCLLTVREGQKPRFVVDASGTLQLTNVPIEADQAAYLARHPPEIWSYALRMAAVVLAKSPLARRWAPGHPEERRGEIEILSTALLARAASRARAAGIPLYFVIFYPDFELTQPGWRGPFLRDTLVDLGVPHLDTAPVLRHVLDSGAATVDDLYDATSHHTPRANALIVDAIIERWPELHRHPEGPADAARVKRTP
jgi:hypothetical protein